ncbi:MAG: polysaccharide biosynthesis protein [Bacteroidota bacterium]
MNSFDLNEIIEKTVKRHISLFEKDIASNKDLLFKRIQGKSALVIGGAGSIGSSFIKELMKFEPEKVIVIDHNENGLAELVRDIRSTNGIYVSKNFETYPMDFGGKVFHRYLRKHGKFNIVANFAAHKHVRSEKDIFSIQAMLENNVIKAFNLLSILVHNKPDHFFCVSTDKAANPVSVMGASKKFMEQMIFTFAKEFKVSTARFANVAFSNGSLPLSFLERINKNQAISAPTDIRRYFVTPKESGQICLLACILGNSGETFFPRFSTQEMTHFSEIAQIFLAHLGLKPVIYNNEAEAKRSKVMKDGIHYPVYFFKSNTSGEKAYEEFYTEYEVVDFERFDNLGVISNSISHDNENIKIMKENIDEMKRLFKRPDCKKDNVVKLLEKMIPTFKHIEKNKSLDQGM